MRRDGLAEPPVASSDPRFAPVHIDPRYARFPKVCPQTDAAPRLLTLSSQAKARVEIDERFKGVFVDPKFRRKTTVDKRGRKTAAPYVAAYARRVSASSSRFLTQTQGT